MPVTFNLLHYTIAILSLLNVHKLSYYICLIMHFPWLGQLFEWQKSKNDYNLCFISFDKESDR